MHEHCCDVAGFVKYPSRHVQENKENARIIEQKELRKAALDGDVQTVAKLAKKHTEQQHVLR